MLSIKGLAQCLLSPHHSLAVSVPAPEGWPLVRNLSIQVVGASSSAHLCPGRGEGSFSLLCWTLFSRHQKPSTQSLPISVISRLCLLAASLRQGTAAGDTPTRSSIAGRVTPQGETTASCLFAGKLSCLFFCRQKCC